MIPGFPDPLQPDKLKNGHFWVFLDFSTIKKYANGKIEDIHFEAQSTSFPTIPNLSGLDRDPLSYGPGSGEKPENFALTLFGVQIRYLYDIKCVFQVFPRALSDSIKKISDRATPGKLSPDPGHDP